MLSPFPGMDPFVERNPIFHELHTQFLVHAQAQLQPQLRPKYIAHLVSTPFAETSDGYQLEEDKQRRIYIFAAEQRPQRQSVTLIELLTLENKDLCHTSNWGGKNQILSRQGIALHCGLNWVVIDLLREGTRPLLECETDVEADYLAYTAQPIAGSLRQSVRFWTVRDPSPVLSIPLLGDDRATLDLAACFQAAFDATGADDEAGYNDDPPLPSFSTGDLAWIDALLRRHGLRTGLQA